MRAIYFWLEEPDVHKEKWNYFSMDILLQKSYLLLILERSATQIVYFKMNVKVAFRRHT